MNEHERAEWLARTIDDILRGTQLNKRPAGLDENDIDALLRAAAGRLNTGEEAARAGLQYEGPIWQAVLQRLDRRSQRREGDPAYASTQVVARDNSPKTPPDREMEGLREIVDMRRRMALRLAAFSDTYKDEVWRQLESRMKARTKDKKGFFSFLRRSREPKQVPEAETLESFLQRLDVSEEPVGPQVDNLIVTANRRRQLSEFSSSYADSSRDEIWHRVTAEISDSEATEASGPDRGPSVRRWAFTGAAAVLLVAALGPLPATGLAGHPAVDAAYLAGRHLGLTETDSAPPVSAAADVIAPLEVTAREAGDLLGLPVVAPATVGGFQMATSQYFFEPITAESGGTFLLTYENGNTAQSLTVFQERASGADFAAASGSASDVVLSDGTTGTYIEGSWMPDGGGLDWSTDGAQTLIFERNGVRTTVRYSGPAMAQDAFVAFADSFL